MWSVTHEILYYKHVIKYFRLELGLSRKCQSFSKCIRCTVASSVLYSTRYSGWWACAGTIATLVYVRVRTNSHSLLDIITTTCLKYLLHIVVFMIGDVMIYIDQMGCWSSSLDFDERHYHNNWSINNSLK